MKINESEMYETSSMYETAIFDFGDPYCVFKAFLWIITMTEYVDWGFLIGFFNGLKPFKKLKKAKPCKNIRKLYLLEGARSEQEAMERLDINTNKNA